MHLDAASAVSQDRIKYPKLSRGLHVGMRGCCVLNSFHRSTASHCCARLQAVYKLSSNFLSSDVVAKTHGFHEHGKAARKDIFGTALLCVREQCRDRGFCVPKVLIFWLQ